MTRTQELPTWCVYAMAFTAFVLFAVAITSLASSADPRNDRPCQALHRSLEKYGPFNYPQLAEAYLGACTK